MARPAPERAPLSQFLGHHFSARVVKAHAIYQRFISNGSENPGRRVARLGMPGDAAQFTEPEAQGSPHRQGLGRLVHAGCEANGVGELQTKLFDWQPWRAVNRFQQLTGDFMPARPPQRAEGALMDLLRVAREKSWPKDIAVEPAHA